MEEHYCHDINSFPLDKFLQRGKGIGKKVLILGEAPAANGWRKSGKAFYTVEGKLIPTGKNLNKLLDQFKLSVEICAFTELIKCFIGSNRKLLNVCGKKCWYIFIKQLELLHPVLIIILGVTTLDIFNKQLESSLPREEISKIQINGKIYSVLPIYHPSPINSTNRPKNEEIFKKNTINLNKILFT